MSTRDVGYTAAGFAQMASWGGALGALVGIFGGVLTASPEELASGASVAHTLAATLLGAACGSVALALGYVLLGLALVMFERLGSGTPSSPDRANPFENPRRSRA
jgi:hypothetical protein